MLQILYLLVFVVAKIQLISASRVLKLLSELFQGFISPGHLREVLGILLLLREPVFLLILRLCHRLLQNLIRHCFFLLLVPGRRLLLRYVVAILVLLLLAQVILLVAGHVVATQLLPEQPPLHLLHHVLLEVQRVEQHHVLVWIQIVPGHIHKVLPIVQYDALSLRQLLLLEVLEQVLLKILQVLRLLELLLKAELHH